MKRKKIYFIAEPGFTESEKSSPLKILIPKIINKNEFLLCLKSHFGEIFEKNENLKIAVELLK